MLSVSLSTYYRTLQKKKQLEFGDLAMNASKITDSLSQLFHTEGHRIVFWHDPDQDFSDLFQDLDLDGVHKIALPEIGQLELKVRLELEDPESKYLLYAPAPEPAMEEDWLLDIRLYSRSFSADRASMLLSDLGLRHHVLREHISARQAFFKSRERLAKLQKLVTPDDRERDLDLKILAVITKADHADFDTILKRLFGAMCSGEQCDVETPPKPWQEIEKFGLTAFFWQEVARKFGVTAHTPSLFDLLLKLLVNDFVAAVPGEAPQAVLHFCLSDTAFQHNIAVFLDNWRRDTDHLHTYRLLSGLVADRLNMANILQAYDATEIQDVQTFEAAERQIIRCIRSGITQNGIRDREAFKDIIQTRRDGFWARHGTEAVGASSSIYTTTYEALEAALDLLALRQAYEGGLHYANAAAMYQAYTQELYRFDQLYRLFHEAADDVEVAGWDVLKGVQKVVEGCYSNWYLDHLAEGWGAFLQADPSLLSSWRLESVPNQHQFFADWVQPVLRQHAKRKIFVIVSDALRFEAAEELTRTINTKSRFKAQLHTQLGVLPSYTALGMAALLPHTAYGFAEGTDKVLVDGQPCATLEQRHQILAQHEGLAVEATRLREMSKEQGRELIQSARVVYIYHNQIDATGDNASSESSAFAATRKAVNELAALVRHVINNLNGSTILVTADHGFLYQDTPPGDLEKSQLPTKPDGIVKAKKRYVLGNDLPQSEVTWQGNTRSTAGTNTDMDFWIPKGVNRFHFAGGAKFIHGGAMPQEIVVPVVQVRELNSEKAQIWAVSQVDIQRLGTNTKIVNLIHKFEFIQTTAVTERCLPRTLVISLRDGDQLISDEQTVTFDSTSESMEERKRVVKLRLKKQEYDPAKDYALVLRDPRTAIEYGRETVTIDLAFWDDF